MSFEVMPSCGRRGCGRLIYLRPGWIEAFFSGAMQKAHARPAGMA
jgi:hypothetical protein